MVARNTRRGGEVQCVSASVNKVVAFERLVKMANMSEEELQALYAWIDEIPLSRQKKNINRDFSDGVLAAEVVHHFLPKLVELHNYSPANSTQQKMDNWRTVNSQYIQRTDEVKNDILCSFITSGKVFSKLNFSIPDDILQDAAASKPGMIEFILSTLRIKVSTKQPSDVHLSPVCVSD